MSDATVGQDHPSTISEPQKRINMTRFDRLVSVLALAGVVVLAGVPRGHAANFTTGTDPAVKFGVHEIVLTGDGTVANPLDTVATVAFTPPSGAKQAKSVYAFHDGGNTWRARVYVGEIGKWTWSSTCKTDKGLDGRSGTFDARESKLRGRLLPHPKNPRHWITEDGRWFLNVVDTAYFLLSSRDAAGQPIPEEDFQAYVRDAVNHGITALMTSLLSGGWTESYFADADCTRLRLENFRFSDRRLRWLLDHHPDIGIELILFPRGSRYASDEQFWKKLTIEQKKRILRCVVARYAAYPQVYWLIANDAHYGKNFPNNNAYVREVGAYFQKHDPWRHPMSTGHARHLDFFFGDEDWATYFHLENAYDLGASQYAKYHHFARPVLLGEDRYEQDHLNRLDPVDMRYYQRRLYWAWLLSGGAANYGGRWWVLHPYTQTGKRETPNPRPAYKTTPHKAALTGLDSVRFLRDYFAARKIELSDFTPDHPLARDPVGGPDVRAPKLMRRGYEEFLLYHPNAAADGRQAKVHAGRKARVRLDLRKADGPFAVEWYRVHDGIAQEGERVAGGAEVELVAPWPGHDVVLRLVRTPERKKPSSLHSPTPACGAQAGSVEPATAADGGMGNRPPRGPSLELTRDSGFSLADAEKSTGGAP